jgi:hypothetical protein
VQFVMRVSESDRRRSMSASAILRSLTGLVIWFYIQIAEQPGAGTVRLLAEQIAGEADANAQQDQVDQVDQIEFESLE